MDYSSLFVTSRAKVDGARLSMNHHRIEALPIEPARYSNFEPQIERETCLKADYIFKTVKREHVPGVEARISSLRGFFKLESLSVVVQSAANFSMKFKPKRSELSKKRSSIYVDQITLTQFE